MNGESQGPRKNEEKWGRELMAAGWIAFPSVILERQQAIGLDALDINILLQLARHWWHADTPPFPSKKALAECIHVDTSTVRRRIQRMKQVGFIKRVARYGQDGQRLANQYRFDGLIDAATPYAREALDARHRQKTETAERRKRKRPRIYVKGAGEGNQ